MSRRKQPQRVPPPIDYGAEALEGDVILHEFSDVLAMALWKALRSVRLWSEVRLQPEGGFFSEGATESRAQINGSLGAFPEVQDSLHRVSRILGNGTVDPAEVADSCVEISRWADQQEALGTALEFAQASAKLLPEDPERALGVARISKRLGDFSRAETWYRHALALSRRSRNRTTYTRSYIGLGTVHIARGGYPAARKMLTRGLRAAQRYSLRQWVAAAHHELLVVAIHTGQAGAVQRHARAAIGSYGSAHPRVPAVAFDVAVFWMTQGYFREALQVFEAIPSDYGGVAERLARSVAITRAAAAAGVESAYRKALHQAKALIQAPAAAQFAGSAWLDIARGALSAGELDEASAAAEEGLRIATERGEAAQVVDAEGILDSVEASRRKARRRIQVVEPKEAPDEVAGFALALEGVLR